MSWGSFLLGFAVGALVFGTIGIIVGGLSQIAKGKPSDLTQLLHEASTSLPSGDIISFTIGRDVSSLPEDEDMFTPPDDPSESWRNN